MATLVLGSTLYAKLGSLTKALDATAVKGIEGSSVMKVFINFPFEKNVVFILHSEKKKRITKTIIYRRQSSKLCISNK